MNERDVMDSIDVDLPCEDVLRCDHLWTYCEDYQGDPHESRLWGDCSYMLCEECGQTREITFEDERQAADERQRTQAEDAQYERRFK